MKIYVKESGRSFEIDTAGGIDISVPVIFGGEQPNTYDVPKASAKAFESGNFIGDTRRGGGCNFEEYSIIPHCNGTHTECVGHISYDRIHVNNFVSNLLIPSTLITVEPESAESTTDSYDPPKEAGDRLITENSLKEKLTAVDRFFLEGLIIRTLPNSSDKKSRRYSKNLPPFFSLEAMKFIRSLEVNHLLLDIPSVDRTFDEGKLNAHHIFWDVEAGSHEVSAGNCSARTVTEMIFADDSIPDGNYFASIHIPNFTADAAPSRVLLFRPD